MGSGVRPGCCPARSSARIPADFAFGYRGLVLGPRSPVALRQAALEGLAVELSSWPLPAPARPCCASWLRSAQPSMAPCRWICWPALPPSPAGAQRAWRPQPWSLRCKRRRQRRPLAPCRPIPTCPGGARPQWWADPARRWRSVRAEVTKGLRPLAGCCSKALSGSGRLRSRTAPPGR